MTRQWGITAGAAVPQERADAIWRRVETLEESFWPSFGSAVEESVNASLGLCSEGLAAIPPERIEAGALNHSLGFAWIREEYAHEFGHDCANGLPWQEVNALYDQAKVAGDLKHIRDVFAPTPNRIFGPPSYVQGYVEEYVDDWLLLLELSSSEAIGLPMGDGLLPGATHEISCRLHTGFAGYPARSLSM